MKDFKNIVPLDVAAKILSRSKSTLYNWRSAGKYPAIFVKLGGSVYIDLEEVDKHFSSQKQANVEKARRLGLLDG